MTDAHLFAVGLALAALSGVRAYLTVFGLGLAGWLGWIDLPPALHVVSSPWVLGTAGALAVIEFCTDKIPGVDSGWDLLQTLLRIPVGAFLAAAMLSPDGHLSTGMLASGAGAALLTHSLKTSTRVLINASPEPLSNWIASLGEDSAALAGLALVFVHPWLALGLIVAAVSIGLLLALWMARRLSRVLARFLHTK